MANETITITGTTAEARSKEGATATIEVSSLIGKLAKPRPSTRGLVLPDRVRYFESDGPVTIFVWEVAPQVHNLKWISKKSKVPYSTRGKKAVYDQRLLALPYLVVFAVFSKVYAVTEGFAPMPPTLGRLFDRVTLETGLAVGGLLALLGLATIGLAAYEWRLTDFGSLDPRATMRQVIPGSILVTLGFQTIFSSFFLSLLGLKRR